MEGSHTVRAQARELRFSHTRRSQTGEMGICSFEESRVGPFGAIPACFSFYVRRSGPTYFVNDSTQTVRSCRLPFGKPSVDAYHIVCRRCGRRRVNVECTQAGDSFYTIIEMNEKGESQSERARRRGRADGVSCLFNFSGGAPYWPLSR